MRTESRLLLAIVFVGLLTARLMEPAQAAPQPNVLIVMTDDQGLGDLSIMGNPILKMQRLGQPGDDMAQLRAGQFHARLRKAGAPIIQRGRADRWVNRRSPRCYLLHKCRDTF